MAPTLMGLPPDMHQMVAVSDAKNRPEHPWDYSWANPADEAKMKAQLEDIARSALGINTPPPAPAPKTRTATRTAKQSQTGSACTAARAAHRRAVSRLRTGLWLRGNPGADRAYRWPAGAGEVRHPDCAAGPLWQPAGSVQERHRRIAPGRNSADAPRDAVDAMADNRGELLFELRGETQRQFALYRVCAARAEKLFVTGGATFGRPEPELNRDTPGVALPREAKDLRLSRIDPPMTIQAPIQC